MLRRPGISLVLLQVLAIVAPFQVEWGQGGILDN
jgi:hypothetical protein